MGAGNSISANTGFKPQPLLLIKAAPDRKIVRWPTECTPGRGMIRIACFLCTPVNLDRVLSSVSI